MIGTSKALLAAAVALVAGAMTSPAAAQAPTSVTGCLSKGTAKDTFTISGADGKAYSLTSSTVKLEQHVGHKVTVTGTSAGMETGALKDTSMAKDTTMKKPAGATGGGVLSVSKLKMVSAECK
jgi:maltose-binding protein MalE